MATRRREPHRTGSRPRGRPAGGGPIATREAVLEAAEDLIRVDGPGVTMEQVAAAVSVTKPSLYRAVGDREALIVALAERFSAKVNETTASAIGPGASGRALIRQVLGAYVEVVDANRNLFLFVASDVPGEDRVSRALQLADISALPLAGTLRHLGLSVDQAATWPYAIVGAAQFMTFRWLRDDDQTVDELADDLTDLLWSGIGGSIISGVGSDGGPTGR